MGSIAKKIDNSDHLYCFSDDILDALVELPRQYMVDIGVRNSSAIFLAGSYLEAFINEQIAIRAAIAPTHLPNEARLWKTLEDNQADLILLC